MKRAIAGLVPVLLSGCFTTETENFHPTLSVGENRIYERAFIWTGSKFKDTVASYSVGIFEVAADTVVFGNKGYVIDVTVYDKSYDSIVELKRRELLLIEDGFVNIYAYQSDADDGFLISLYKANAFDTLQFNDRIRTIKTNLVMNSAWLMRSSDEKFGGLPISKEMIGIEKVEFEGVFYDCYLIAMHSFVSFFSWVSEFGLIKSEYYSESYNHSDDDVDTIRISEKYQLIRKNNKSDLARLTESTFLKNKQVIHINDTGE